ncbi:MAG: hypothetical protein C1943_15550 [Halochromatium sp.]|nr:hypothetical protein [Halochromatium sp.]
MVAYRTGQDMQISSSPMRSSDRLGGLRPFLLPGLILAIGLTMTALATLHMEADVTAQAQRERVLIGDEIATKIRGRLHAHAQLLRCGAAFFMGSEQVNRDAWRDFVERSKVPLNLPGVLGVGFARVIPPEHLAEHLQAIRAEGFPDYRVWPPDERGRYTAIVYLEPFNARNRRAFGYNMFSEPVRRAAMERARDQDVAALSGKVLLVQETVTDVQAGTLMYVPVYRPGLPTATVDQRRAALIGWVYSPYRMNDLMHGILGTWERADGKRIRLAIYDGDQVTPETLLYDSEALDPQRLAPAPASANALRIPIDFNGQRWTLSFSQYGPPAHLLDDVRVVLVAGSGMVISVLVAALVGAFLRTRLHALQLVAELAARQRAEQGLLKAEHKYREIFETSPAGIYRTTAQGRYIDVNPAGARILGYESPQALIAGISDIDTQVYANPRDREVFAGVLAEQGEIHNYEVEMRRRDGQTVWVSADAAAVRDAEGRFVAYHGTMSDITERVRSTLLRDMVTAVGRLAVSSDSADGFRQALPALLSTRLGYPIVAVERYDAARAEMVFAGSVGIPAAADGRLRVPVEETLSGQVATSGKALVETAADARSEYTFAALRALGVITFVCVPMTLGTRVMGTLALADVRRRPDAEWVVDMLRTLAETATDAIGRLETQAALRASERNFRGLLDNLHAGVVVHAPDTCIRFSNPMASQLLGLSTQQMQGLAAVDLAWRFIREDGTPMPHEEYPVARVLASGTPLDNLILGIQAPDRDGPTWVQCEAHLIHDDRGQIQQIVVTFFDITARKQAEVELGHYRDHLETLVQSRTLALNKQLVYVREQEHLLIHQARLAAMGEMLGNIAHQWRQPLNALALVLGNLQDAERHQELTSEYLARKVADAQRLIDKMSTTISDFRNFFRPDKSAETFDLCHPVNAALDLMAASLKAHGIVVVIDLCEEVWMRGTPNEYSQVILNLLSNAKDAILAHQPNGGQIIVRVDRDGDQARVRVADTGGGMTTEAMERLFEPYFSTKPDGTGIGLYMSKMIIEKGMGGRLYAGNLKTGAEFTVLTPLAEQAPT